MRWQKSQEGTGADGESHRSYIVASHSNKQFQPPFTKNLTNARCFTQIAANSYNIAQFSYPFTDEKTKSQRSCVQGPELKAI